MDVEIIIEWDYAPPECLEQRVDLSTAHYLLTIEAGRATARLDPAFVSTSPDINAVLEREIRSRLRAAQLFTYAPFELSRPVVTHVWADGTRRCHLDADGGAFLLAGGSADIRVLDSSGRVLRDTKQERIADKAALGALIVKHDSDSTLGALVRSFDAAMRDRDDELVHLYEIRDALVAHFSGERAARRAVGVSAGDWSRLGWLCNDEPLRQGRHRGRKVSASRDATISELGDARSIAVSMIRGYIEHLERGVT